MGELLLVLGGVRSGKSRHAERLASAHPPVIYLATAWAGDAEMARRIALHQERRARYAPAWQTIEEPWDAVGILASESASGAGSLLVECLTLWLTNLMLGLPDRAGLDDGAILHQVTGLADAARAGDRRVIVVSNEAGCGLVPPNALARRFGDLLGEANQRLATAATEVHVCWAGIPLRIK